MEKHYTPTLEEFRVGFEYEYKSTRSWGWFDDSNGEWKKEKFCGGSIEGEGTEVDAIQHPDNEVRVKCLDDKDIESLGGRKGHKSAVQQNYEFGDEKDKWIVRRHPDGHMEIWRLQQKKGGATEIGPIINPVIRNKSELKVFLTQIGIDVQ